LDIYLMWTVSNSAHSNNLKLIETPQPIKFGLFKIPGLTHKIQNTIRPVFFCNAVQHTPFQ